MFNIWVVEGINEKMRADNSDHPLDFVIWQNDQNIFNVSFHYFSATNSRFLCDTKPQKLVKKKMKEWISFYY